ncbi:helix-turn-helix domain-containing protein [Devosia sp. A449]
MADHIHTQLTTTDQSLNQITEELAAGYKARTLPRALYDTIWYGHTQNYKGWISPRTLVRWFIMSYPHYRDDQMAEARKLLDQGLTQIQVAAHCGVTTRTIRNWISS